MAAPIRLSRITAVMLGVRDLAQSIEFYRDKLGLKVMMQEPSLALLDCGGTILGLSRGHVNLAPHVAGATEVVFAVEGVRGAHKYLAEKGIVFMSEPRQATPTDWVAHFKDPDGHVLSVFGPEGQENGA
jgi:catechol 2,3-dioxygenase-like lactoylglutathione lyase family enzyme